MLWSFIDLSIFDQCNCIIIIVFQFYYNIEIVFSMNIYLFIFEINYFWVSQFNKKTD